MKTLLAFIAGSIAWFYVVGILVVWLWIKLPFVLAILWPYLVVNNLIA